ncbi:hypothetical protein L4C33_19810 [Vibrio makurazakiensis]
MKHFLPSSVMLTPFLVKYYDEDDDSNDELDAQSEDAIQTQAATNQSTE